MRASPLFFAGLVTLFVSGCDSCSKPSSTDRGTPGESDASSTKVDAATAESTPTDAGIVAALADAGTQHAMTNCPTSVSGAEVAIADVAGGVEVTVTAKSDLATTEIRDRAKKLAEVDKVDAGGTVQHNHQGAGGGMTGRCTIILRNTNITTAEIPGGTKVTVKPKDAKELDWVRRETRERNIEAKSASAVGAGALRMAHCASAVEGAKTDVKDTKDGVVVTVTGPADKVAEIRARAKHTADVAAKGEGSKIQHSGEGTGGGGVGRCPIVVEGDTAVALKDLPNGVEATVTAKKDVAALQKEAKERAANFK